MKSETVKSQKNNTSDNDIEKNEKKRPVNEDKSIHGKIWGLCLLF